MSDSTPRPPSDPTQPLKPVLEILTPDDIQYLRSHYDEKGMADTARKFGTALYPNAAGWVDFLIGYYFESSLPPPPDRSSLDASQREVLLIGLLANKFQGTGAFFGLHLYWGLMTGLSVQEIADAIMLSALYSGINVNNAAMVTLNKVLTLLNGFCTPQKQPAGSGIVSDVILKKLE